jgi:hypothetical protein
MAPKRRRESDAKHTDEEKLDSALEDSFPASDPVSFIQPAPNDPNDTPLDKEREQGR